MKLACEILFGIGLLCAHLKVRSWFMHVYCTLSGIVLSLCPGDSAALLSLCPGDSVAPLSLSDER